MTETHQEHALEVYRQRYETFRHLDRLRWQMLQICVTTAAVVIAFGARGSIGPEWWVFAAAGTLFLTLGTVMLRIGHGIAQNADALRVAAAAVGDRSIPPSSTWWRSVSFWVAVGILTIGVMCFVAAYDSRQGGREEEPCTKSSSATITQEIRNTESNSSGSTGSAPSLSTDP